MSSYLLIACTILVVEVLIAAPIVGIALFITLRKHGVFWFIFTFLVLLGMFGTVVKFTVQPFFDKAPEYIQFEEGFD